MGRKEADDKSICAALREDPGRGFEALYTAYYDRIYYFLLNISSDVHLSFDLAQDVFVKAYRKGPFDGDRIGPWLYKVALNEFYMNRRSCFSSVRNLLKNIYKYIENGRDPSAEAVERQIEKEEKSELRACLKELGDDDRAILVLKYYDSFSYEQISETLEIEAGTVMSRLSRAREKLRRLMKDGGR